MYNENQLGKLLRNLETMTARIAIEKGSFPAFCPTCQKTWEECATTLLIALQSGCSSVSAV